MRRTSALLAAAAAAVGAITAGSAPAQEVVYGPNPPEQMPGRALHAGMPSAEYRFLYTRLADFPLDAGGTRSPLEGFGEHRLRVEQRFTLGSFHIRGRVDVLDGLVFGDREDLAPDARRIERRDRARGLDPGAVVTRDLYVQWRSPYALIRLGETTSHFGLGVIANGGDEDPAEFRFGAQRYGDVVYRVLVATAPLKALGGAFEHVTLLAAGDVVFRDENADLRDGDLAFQVTGGLSWRHPDWTNGVVYTYRHQEDDDGDRLEAHVIDVNGRNRIDLLPGRGDRGPRLRLHLDYEGVAILGHTDRYVASGAPDGLSVRSFGAVGRVGLDLAPHGLDAVLETGFASGDADPYDDRSGAFFFDPDYRVGMVFFEDVLPVMTARSIEVASSPDNVAVPAKGLDVLASQGRVTNALYLMPQAAWRPPLTASGLRPLRLAAGALFLWSPALLADAWNTYRNGGAPASPLGGPTRSRYLGTEVMVGVEGEWQPVRDHAILAAGVQHAWFLPGAALRDRSGDRPDPVWKVLIAASLRLR